jgi:pyruvate dehydrogenase E1 component alpha subunit
MEIMTYRYRGHSMSDPAKYRTKEEVEDYKEHRDPIMRLLARMNDIGIAEEDIKVIDSEVKKIVNEAAQFAQDSPQPDESELWTDILVEQ